MLTLAGCMGDGAGLLIAFGMLAGVPFGVVLLSAGLAWLGLRLAARARRVAPGWPHAEPFEGADRDLEAARSIYERLLGACPRFDWPGAELSPPAAPARRRTRTAPRSPRGSARRRAPAP